MNRRSFFRSLLLGVAALPVVGKLFADKKESAAVSRPGSRFLFTVPKEAGAVKSTKMTENHVLVMCCENGIWFSEAPYKECKELKMVQYGARL